MLTINEFMNLCLEPCQQEIEIFDNESGEVIYKGYIDELDDVELCDCTVDSWDITKSVICFNISFND